MRLSSMWRGRRADKSPDFASHPLLRNPMSASDVALAYRVFLGRHPETPDVVQEKAGLLLQDVVVGFLTSPEFREKIVEPVLSGKGAPTWAGPLHDEDGDTLLQALSIDAEALRAADHWAEFLRIFLEATAIRDALVDALGDDNLGRFEVALEVARDRMLQERAGRERTRTALQACAAGLKVISSQDILWEPGTGQFHFLSADAFMEVLLRPERVSGASAARLSVRLVPADGLSSEICVYIDEGAGFQEHEKIVLRPDSNVICHFILAAPSTALKLRLDLSDQIGSAQIEILALERLEDIENLRSLLPVAGPDETSLLSRVTRSNWDRMARQAGGTRGEATAVSRIMTDLVAGVPVEEAIDYATWIEVYRTPGPDDYRRMSEMTECFAHKTRFSFIVPTYNTDLRFLRECLESLLAQTYPNFEICVADDNSPDRAVGQYLLDLATRDQRVKFRQRRTNGHISEASNTAASLATGDFLVLVDHDDAIPDYALFVVAAFIERHPDASVFFSDEDKITADGLRFNPYFKSDFNEFLMFGHNMVSHLGVYRTSLFRQIGGFRRTFEGSQDYDLFLRCYEAIGPNSIVHIPHVLYHWRAIPGSTAVSADQKSYAIVAAQAALNGFFERRRLPFRSVDAFAPGVTALDFTATSDARVSVIIPTRNGLDVLQPCIDSVLAVRDEALEIVVVDNGSSDPGTLTFLATLAENGIARVVRYEAPFNFSDVNNLGASHATGEILCFLNDDTEVVSRRWLARARMLLSRSDIGAVGARLLFPNGTVQHAGIVLGLGTHRVAGHPHVGWAGDAPGYFTKARLIAEVSAVTAACLFVRRAEFEAAGGFDPLLRVAYNDVDLCLKLRGRGLKVVYDPDITLIHKESHSRGSDTSGPAAVRLRLEADLMRSRWGDLLSHDPYYSPNLSLDSGSFRLACPPRVQLPFESTDPRRQTSLLLPPNDRTQSWVGASPNELAG